MVPIFEECFSENNRKTKGERYFRSDTSYTNISLVNTTLWSLPASMPAGQVLYTASKCGIYRVDVARSMRR